MTDDITVEARALLARLSTAELNAKLSGVPNGTWFMDSLTPELTALLTRLLARVEALEAQVGALEAERGALVPLIVSADNVATALRAYRTFRATKGDTP